MLTSLQIDQFATLLTVSWFVSKLSSKQIVPNSADDDKILC